MVPRRALRALGGAYSPYVRIWRGGVGSPRIIYLRGITHFDRLHRGVAGEIAFLTMEELPSGFLFRLNINQRIACVGARKAAIDSVTLIANRVRILTRNRLRFRRKKIVHRGTLIFYFASGDRVDLQIVVREFEAVRKYLKNSGLADRFSIEVSDDPPERDFSHWVHLPDT